MDVSTVLLRLLVGRGFVPVPGPGSPIAGGKPEGRRRRRRSRYRIRVGSGCGCTSSEIIKDMKAKKEELGRGGATRGRRRRRV